MIQENPSYFKAQEVVSKDVFGHWDMLVNWLLWVGVLIILIIAVNLVRNVLINRKKGRTITRKTHPTRGLRHLFSSLRFW